MTHSEVLYNFVKPPIHGWAFARLRRQLPEPLDRHQLTETYQRLSGWTTFWLTQRRMPGHPLPTTSTATTAVGTTPPPSTPAASSKPPTCPHS